MEVAISVELETVGESSLGHLIHGVLDSLELALDLGVILSCVAQSTKYVESLRLLAFQDQPGIDVSILRNPDLDIHTILAIQEDLGSMRE